ncbi:hypothetical protein TNCV_3549661 [Trichonephila clavipes]|nr:hypothetical protein TNCV_3549661 [Trichonephila clavipes]
MLNKLKPCPLRADLRNGDWGFFWRGVTRTVREPVSSEFRPKRAGKQLRLISGREILSLYTPPPAEAGVMWRVRLGSRVVGELICRYR